MSMDIMMVLFNIPFMILFFIGIDFCAGIVATFDLLNACTIHHLLVTLRTQKVGEL